MGYGLVNGFTDHLYTPLGTCTLHITDTQTSVLGLLQSPLTVSWQRLLQMEFTQRLSTDKSTGWVPGWRPFHTNVLVFSSQTDFQLNCCQPAWGPRYIASVRTQQKIPPPTIFLLLSLAAALRQIGYRFRGNVFTDRYQATHDLSGDRCIATVVHVTIGSRDSAVGIATGYDLDGREVRVRVPVGGKISPIDVV
jgi:hypothetical protein